MMAMDLSKATPNERACCFGEAFRDVQMVELNTDDAGTLLTTVILNGKPVTLVGDPEKALTVYTRGRTGAKVLQALRSCWPWRRAGHGT